MLRVNSHRLYATLKFEIASSYLPRKDDMTLAALKFKIASSYLPRKDDMRLTPNTPKPKA